MDLIETICMVPIFKFKNLESSIFRGVRMEPKVVLFDLQIFFETLPLSWISLLDKKSEKRRERRTIIDNNYCPVLDDEHE